MSFSQGTRSLEEVCDLITDGSHFSPTPQAEGFLIVNAKDIPNGCINLDTCTKISRVDWETLKKQGCAPIPGDVLLSKDGTIGRVVSYESDLGVVLLSSIAILRPNDSVDSSYLSQALRSDGFRRQLLVLESGSALRRIVLRDIKKLEFPFPERKVEQSKIAEILSTVDRVIYQTETLITKQQRIKTGLTQDLLTRGIDEHGSIRDEGTHQFKDSPLGRIPAEWTCEPLSHFVPSAEYGISTSLGEFGIPVLRMNNLTGGEADLAELKYTDKPVPEKLWLRWGDVLFNRTNSWEHVGRTGMWRNECESATFASYLVRLNPDRTVLSSELLNIWLNWSKIQIAMRRFATPAVQQVNINPTNLRRMPAAFPNRIEEQTEIVTRINKHSEILHNTRAVLKKLQSVKTAVMQDLLTGKKRVTALLEPAPPLIKQVS